MFGKVDLQVWEDFINLLGSTTTNLTLRTQNRTYEEIVHLREQIF